MLSNCGAGEESWESLGQQGNQFSQSWKKSTLNIHWKDWCSNWSSNTSATWCKEPTHWKRLMLGKIERKRREQQRMRWLDSITYSMNMNLSKLQETVEDWRAWCAAVHEITESDTTWWLNNSYFLQIIWNSDSFSEIFEVNTGGIFLSTPISCSCSHAFPNKSQVL